MHGNTGWSGQRMSTNPVRHTWCSNIVSGAFKPFGMDLQKSDLTIERLKILVSLRAGRHGTRTIDLCFPEIQFNLPQANDIATTDLFCYCTRRGRLSRVECRVSARPFGLKEMVQKTSNTTPTYSPLPLVAYHRHHGPFKQTDCVLPSRYHDQLALAPQDQPTLRGGQG